MNFQQISSFLVDKTGAKQQNNVFFKPDFAEEDSELLLLWREENFMFA